MIVLQILLFITILVINEFVFHVYYKDDNFIKPKLINHIGYGVSNTLLPIISGLFISNIYTHGLIFILSSIWSLILCKSIVPLIKPYKLSDIDPNDIKLYHITSAFGSMIILLSTKYILLN